MASQVHIRRALQSDSPALSRICLLTADAGNSAEHLHTFGELPGVMYAEPYVHLPSAGGFVLVDTAKGVDGAGEVVGYVLAAFDTKQFENELEEQWFPKYRVKYPYPNHDTSAPLEAKEADARYIRNIHNPPHASPTEIAFSPAHMHIDILPEYQRKGFGRRLIGALIQWLKDEKGLDRMWLGMDPRNTEARAFYEKLGFRHVEGAADNVMGLEFAEWRD
ncbi:acyl-CoA N-acyltransferase [Panus rudis PR-1116 ss-1]|nr:acyl-CoA N-acyltransferase [Panus rudis PR-1116 ss-1]